MLFFLLLSIIFYLVPSNINAQVNIINRWDGTTIQNIHENFGDNAFVVVAADPNSDDLIEVINNNSFNWLIRGHSHWLEIGNLMLNNPQEAVNQWVTFLNKINKPVYFEPWNEPARLDTECNNLSIEVCAEKIRNYINQLAPRLPNNVTLTSPAWDPYHPDTPAIVNAIGNIPYSVISMHIYSPQMALNYRNRLNQLGVRGANSMPVVLTETGALANGESGAPVYLEKPLCNMYCSGTVDFWQTQNIIGWALFSFAPGDYAGGWDLWSADCVIDALQNNCHCDTCSESDMSLIDIIQNSFNRTVRKYTKGWVARNWFSGPSTPNNRQEYVEEMFGPENRYFRLPDSLGWVPSENYTRPFPGEDVLIKRNLDKGEIEFKNGIAEFCVPPSTITYNLKFFPATHPNGLKAKFLNILSTHHYVFAGLQTFTDIIRDYTGEVYGEQYPALDPDEKEGDQEKLLDIGISKLKAGQIIRALPNSMYEKVGNDWALDYLFKPADPSIETDVNPIMDKPVLWTTCKGIGITNQDFPERMPDGRIDRTKVEGCGNEAPVPIKASIFFCCNRDFFESRGLDFSQICGQVTDNTSATSWPCNLPHSMHTYLYGSAWKRMVVEGLTNSADLSVYFESCFPADDDEMCKAENAEVYNTYFGEMTPEQRFRVSPYKVEGRENSDRNTFLTSADNKCQSCQVIRMTIPSLLGAVDTCNRFAETVLPISLYKNLSKKYKDKDTKRFFPCNLGDGVKANGPVSGMANKTHDTPTNLASADRIGQYFINPTHKVENCGATGHKDCGETEYTDPETGATETRNITAPHRCSASFSITSRDRLYIPHYNEIQQCVDFLYSLHSVDIQNALADAVASINSQVGLFELPVEAEFNDPGGVYAGIDEDTGTCDHWATNPKGVQGKSILSRDGKLNLPGGLLELSRETRRLLYIPSNLQ